jgi:hypothetical protein
MEQVKTQILTIWQAIFSKLFHTQFTCCYSFIQCTKSIAFFPWKHMLYMFICFLLQWDRLILNHWNVMCSCTMTGLTYLSRHIWCKADWHSALHVLWSWRGAGSVYKQKRLVLFPWAFFCKKINCWDSYFTSLTISSSQDRNYLISVLLLHR